MITPTIQIDHNNALQLASAISLLVGRAMESLSDAPPNSADTLAISELMAFQNQLIHISATAKNGSDE